MNTKIYIERNFNNLLKAFRDQDLLNRSICIISDDKVSKFYLEEIKNILSKEYNNIYSFIFPEGEQSKNLHTINNMYDYLLENNLDRKTVIIALGGGVTGDMAGFLASTYKRGIPFVQIPTSLLAQVDSSIGGKVGVDYKEHKNLIGSFYQPKFIYSNISTIKTLDKENFYNGMAEVIKHSLILDSDYFDYLNKNHINILNLESKYLYDIISKSIEIKTGVVKEDEYENGLREILNFGHTIGHAIESLMHFKYLHGECVALGIICASFISYKKDFINTSQLDSIYNILKKYNLLNIDTIPNNDIIYNELFYDKKVKNNKINFVLLKSIGENIRTDDISKENIYESIDYLNNILKGEIDA